MIACLDVWYGNLTAYAAGLVFQDWADPEPLAERVVPVARIQAYRPGQFFRRELPCLLAVLREFARTDIVIVDGYVWLDGANRPGLGAHLYEALEGKAAVIGVAKTRFRGAVQACEVKRGRSSRPLCITAVGLAPEVAAGHIRTMHGPDRIPTLLKRVDSLSRQSRNKSEEG